MSQRNFAGAEYAMKNKRTRREKFLADIERVVPWGKKPIRDDVFAGPDGMLCVVALCLGEQVFAEPSRLVR